MKKNENDGNHEYIEIWEDLVKLEDLIKALFLCTFLAFAFALTIGEMVGQSLFLGLIGAITGFIISSIWISPKRDIE